MAVLFWLLVWQVAAIIMGQALFLPSPVAVLLALWRLVQTGPFWQAAFASLLRIALGFFTGFAAGVALGALSAAVPPAKTLLEPPMHLVRATPVASFVILALMWFGNRWLSVFVSFLMVLPVMYTAAQTGIAAADTRLLEMARVFRINRWRTLRAVYLPALSPSVLAGAALAVGLAWKSGVAAEVIGLPQGSIGERMYEAKIFLQMPEMFAWTAVVLVLSWAFGRVVTFALQKSANALQRGWRA